MTSTAELVTQAQSGDPGAFSELVRRYERAVVVTAWGVLGDFHAAQDAGQEAFLIAYRNLDRLRATAAFSSWLLRIARLEALRIARRPTQVASDVDPAHLAQTADSPAWAEAYGGAVAAIGRLPEQERAVVVLRYLDGHSVGQIADMTGRPVGTVTKQLSRGVGRLRKWLVGAAP
jgi:RNA polymerase sigma-70 factor (ECF subfamily)